MNEPANEDEKWISDLFHTVDTMPVPPRDPVRIERRTRRRASTQRLLVAAAVIAVALASGAFAVSATRNDPQMVRTGSSGGAAPSDPAPAPRGPASTEQPADDTVASRGQHDLTLTRKDVEAVYEKMLDCMEHSGIVVTDSSISVTKYDVSDTLDYDGAKSKVEGGDLQKAVAVCRADLEAVSDAWTEAAGPYPTNEVNAAVRECLDAEPGPALSIADAQSHAGEVYGKCMREAQHQVLGTDP